MATVTNEVSREEKRKRWPIIAAALGVALMIAAVAAWLLWPRPLVTAQGYIAAQRQSAPIYDADGNVLQEAARGSTVTYVVGEDKDYPDMVQLVLGEESFGWLKKENLTDDANAVVTTQSMYVRTAVNLTDESGAAAGILANKGQVLEVLDYEGLAEDGSVARYRVRLGDEEGFVRAGYLVYTEEEALAQYDQKLYALHAGRGDSWGGGDAAGLDYFPREKKPIAGNTMPSEVKALYLNNAFTASVDTYLDIAAGCGVNAFVIDIQDGGAIGYASPTMEKYSPSAYESAYNTLEEYQAAVKKIKEAGYYVIGRITTFNDPNFAVDHPEALIASTATGQPMEIGGMYWPSAYNRYVWQYKVDLALEAVELMGFHEIQFDYVRFPDGTWEYEDSEIDYRNAYGESKAQAIQRFLMYACDRIRPAGAYVSADVFGECAENYVCAYGQYWPAISAVVDAISAMPYPDHYSPVGSWLPWEHPYDMLHTFGEKAAARQAETASPAAVRTWLQAYDAIREPYPYYGPDQIADQIRALRDTGNTGGYMTWNAASSIQKYYDIAPALN